MDRKTVKQKSANTWTFRALLLWCLCTGASAVAAETDSAADIEITGYAREMPPGTPMGAAYLTLRELAGHARILERIELPAYPQGSVELHTTEAVAGVSRMRALSEITLPGGGAIEMRPGAVHLMVRGVTLKAGQSLSLRLVFADGSAHEVTLPVRGLGEQAPEAGQEEAIHHGHHHG
ncbi:copper chaperone PCu(A)C [Microbulbifer pacificus]|uniref:Copper chaperone PCu(A)C n=1 Tax=Microbulbifer pacificus TaxID=407164 RepID=A0AAU0N1W0_9GAMM|nr:copper chaperone PCu(A)C [Microbulbifer pacificus]WOX06942.1 copper chaperone PCu(A)C [Microbulbifer pacificus]